MNTVIAMARAIDWNNCRIHQNSILSPITKILIILDREHNETTFRDLGNLYRVSHTTCWRIYHDVTQLLNQTFFNSN